MNYNDLADMIDEMTPQERQAGVKVKVGEAKEYCDVKDFKIAERSVGANVPPFVFFVI